jgi:hypothetical protein
MKIRNLTPLVAAASLAVSSVSFAQGQAARTALHDSMRRLWEDHVTWTRLFIVSTVGGLADTTLTTERLLRNQDDIGAVVAVYYGAEAGTRLTALLKTHITTAKELVIAAKADDKGKVADARKRWYANADDIATFLSTANPKRWPLSGMKAAMKTHLDQTLDEATHRIQGNYDTEINDYDHIVTHILTMADMLSDGIAAQFPQKLAARGQ